MLWRIALLALLIVDVSSERNAFISILSSDDFLLPAKVVAHRLRTLNDSIPYVIVATEDVSNATIQTLLSRDVTVLQIHKIDTPFLDTHVGAKYQYTKIRLWSLTEYDVLFHVDLDSLPVSELSPAFKCGRFCATFRHSDKFNAGIFVLRPNITVYLDLLEKSSRLDSYDGGDQGFFNTYFDDLRYAPMFNDRHPDEQNYKSDIMRISAAYNYDIGMYYMNGGRLLIEPKIIHYTLGPTKPWTWWTYPVFDLNQEWLDARMEMEAAFGEPDPDRYLVLWGILIFLFIISVRELALFVTRSAVRNDVLTPSEVRFLPAFFTIFSLLTSYQLTPGHAHPVASWIYFSCCTVGLSVISSDVYAILRLGRSAGLLKLTCSAAISLSLIGSSWTFLALIPTFGPRAVVTIPIAVANAFFISLLVRFVVLARPKVYHCTKYQMLPVTKDCVQ